MNKYYQTHRNDILTQQRIQKKIYYQLHRNDILAKKKIYYQLHREKIAKRNREYYINHKDKPKKCAYKRLYNIDLKDFNSMLLQQNNRCAICNESLDLTNPKKVCIDHDHSTGKVRGILCRNCNLAIGFFRDNPEYTNNATLYLKRSD